MNRQQRMIEAARGAMVHVLGLAKDDRVLVVTDEAKKPIGAAFAAAARNLGCPTETYLIPEADRPLTGIPAAMTAHLQDRTVIVNAFGALTREIPFRIEWILAVARTKRIRLGHSPGITEAMMTDGPMNVDYAAMADRARKLIAGFADAVTVRITAPAGTDLVLDITGRSFLDDIRATVEKGCNLPCGEIYCAPVETAASGLLVIDGTISNLGAPSSPLRITLQDGRIADLTCDDPELLGEIRERTGVDDEASVIGELGIGLNPGARLTGNMLEDEKAFRTAHIAFGNNADFPGGKNRSSVHEDYLFRRPTFVITYRDGSRRTLIEDGVFRV